MNTETTAAKNMIDLQVIDGNITAVYTGPHAKRVFDLFGTVYIPTPYTAAYDINKAAEHIRKLNPDVVVYPSHKLTSETDRAPGQR